MDAKAPVISVIMPTYNTPIPMLRAAVDSILKQTYGDFEFLIIDDCSTDASPGYLASLADPRVTVIRNRENMGITRSLNAGLAQARGRYIARMDSDDISFPERLEKQLAFMEAHPDVVVCGTWIQAFGDADYRTERVIPPQEYLRCTFLFGNIYGLSHPTAMFRGDVLRQNGITYDENLPTAQDYGMWTACAEVGEIANVEEVLLHYRVHTGQISIEKRQLQMQCALRVQSALLRRVLPEADEEQAFAHVQLCRERVPSRQLTSWVIKLKRENRRSSAYDPDIFDRAADAFVEKKFVDFAKVARTPGQLLRLLTCCPGAVRGQVLSTMFQRMMRIRKRSETV